jgi:hypothetical protein
LADDFQAEPGDPAVPDPGPEPEPPKARAEDSGAIPAGLQNERLVEVCSAANGVEAYALCNALEEATIRARVVGEDLGNAAGSLPLGEPIAPRIWVRESDAIRAREIIDQWFKGAGSEPIEWPESDGPPEWETPAEQEEDVLPSDERFRFLSQLLFRSSLSASARYAYVVDRKVYCAVVNDMNDVPADHVPIHFDPHHPADHVVGPIAPPWVVLAYAFGVGAFMMFVGYQFR